MSQPFDVATIVIISALSLLALIGVAVLLLIVVHQRRMRHRADVVELKMQHAEEVGKVEREVVSQTLSEIGMELHDNVGQLLTALRLDISALIVSTNNNAVAGDMKSTLDLAIAELRRLSHSLNADHLRERPFTDALQEECTRLHRPGTRDVLFLCDVQQPIVSPEYKVVLFRIFQEAMNNALKHAKASRIIVTLGNNGTLRLSIQDNGVGFEQNGKGHDGHGLGNIRKRAELIGFKYHLYSVPGKGTTVTVSK